MVCAGLVEFAATVPGYDRTQMCGWVWVTQAIILICFSLVDSLQQFSKNNP
eukprot:NODE_3640_length_352_cov_10.102310_g3558_i0.p3 GENE.NODE_3640_length_352_cov_10.102310_g3558_i0~~NODE_3640_length_352_cov_10.102310_g3558_i0.p3  ORF type:complete len:51 (-),score=4.07 NODE_3640_length_352_cov_10.102310_g3558_i0:88-240(-)